jgi:hypothetical protein
MEHEGPPSHITCEHVPVGTSLPGFEMMHVSMVLGSPSLQSLSVWHSLMTVVPQPPSVPAPPEPVVEVKEMPVLDVPPAPPVPPVPPVLAELAELDPLPPAVWFDPLHAANAMTSTEGQARRHRVSPRASTRPMPPSSPWRQAVAMGDVAGDTAAIDGHAAGNAAWYVLASFDGHEDEEQRRTHRVDLRPIPRPGP